MDHDKPNRVQDSHAESGDLTAAQLADYFDRSRWWVSKLISDGRIPYTRVGPPPIKGRRDTRPLRFTPEQVAEIEALVNHKEYVPAGGAA